MILWLLAPNQGIQHHLWWGYYRQALSEHHSKDLCTLSAYKFMFRNSFLVTLLRNHFSAWAAGWCGAAGGALCPRSAWPCSVSSAPCGCGSPLVMVMGSRVAAWVWYSGFGSWPCCGTLSCTSLLQKPAWGLGVCLNRRMSDESCWAVLGELVLLSAWLFYLLWNGVSGRGGNIQRRCSLFSSPRFSLPLLAGISVPFPMPISTVHPARPSQPSLV